MSCGRVTSVAVRILFFGTYDARLHPRVATMMEGLATTGADVVECNEPLGLDTSWRVKILQRPWLLPVLIARIAAAWWRLFRRARRLPRPDAVVVGYMGHFDVHLGRRLWPRATLALDHLVSAADTAADRRVNPGLRRDVLTRIDRAAVMAADIPVVDTDEHRELLPPEVRERSVVVPVGAPSVWFHPPADHPVPPLRVVFFGLYTPLQGAPAIGRAIALLSGTDAEIEFTMIGTGQDYAATLAAAGEASNTRWFEWVAPEELPDLVARHDVCLGIFGTAPKAHRVVPNKVFQGAAAGCAIVTSETAPQRGALSGAAVFVPPGDPAALAAALRGLAEDPIALLDLRRKAHERAEEAFRPAQVVAELRERLVAGGRG
jgi:glycosyltransferase involved in cell wall biosynthesis